MTRPHPHDTRGKEAHRRQQKEAVEREQLLEVEDLKKLMREEWGRRIAYRLFERAGMIYGDAQLDEELWNPNSMTMSRDVGRRGVMWRADHLIRRHCPDLWNTMLLEQEL